MLIFILTRWQMTITLNGGDTSYVAYGHEYVDPGATAHFTGRSVAWFDMDYPLEPTEPLDTYVLGEQTLRYRASHLIYHAHAERTVIVVNDTPPILELGAVDTELSTGDAWQDSYTAYDAIDGNLTAQVVVSGTVDTTRPGMYDLTYTVTNSLGSTATAVRTVTVQGDALPVTGSKIVFLTFDDGPWNNTDELLDILARHNVKATFFVTGGHPDYFDCIGRAAAEGHTVAVHSYTHNFDSVYQSSDAYWSDFERMNDVIEEQTGSRANIFRFPGGVSNTISSYNPGIMTRLASEATARGLDWFDWNVDCGDGGGLNDTDKIYENIISGMQNHDISVVLCHDTHGTTVAAIDAVLTWGEENGYTFMSLAKGITTCHHGIAN